MKKDKDNLDDIENEEASEAAENAEEIVFDVEDEADGRMKKAKGSLTLEAAIVLPIFLSLIISLISVLEMMNLYARVEFALHETAREMALMMYPAVYAKTVGEELFDEEFDWELPDENILNPVMSETLARALFTENYEIGRAHV